jgi:hypothetical protein
MGAFKLTNVGVPTSTGDALSFNNVATISTLTLSNALAVTYGGTGATTASGARTNLSAASSGANSDITSLTGLTTALAVAYGGTGSTTATGARANLSAASSGANSDITSLTGLTTPLSVSQGGTGLTSAGTNGYVLTSNGTNFVMAAARPASKIQPVATWLEFLNLSPGLLVYENSSGIPAMTQATVTGIANDAAALGISRLTTDYIEYQGYWFYNPTFYTRPGTVALTFTATSTPSAATTVTAGAAFFQAGDVGSILILRSGTTVYRAFITAYTSTTVVSAIILSGNSTVSVDISSIVYGVTSVPADSVSTSPLASSTWTANAWELRQFPWDYETSRFGFYWRDAINAGYVSLGGTCDSMDLVQTLLTACTANNQQFYIGLGRNSDTPVLNDILNIATVGGATLGALPGTLISSPSTTLTGTGSALTSPAWTVTTGTSALSAFLVGNTYQEIFETNGVGRAIIKGYNSGTSVSIVIITPFSTATIASGNWQIRQVANGAFRPTVSVLNRAYQSMVASQKVAADLISQYGSNASFGGFYISHEPTHVTRQTKYFFTPLVTLGLGGYASLTSYAKPVNISPASPIDTPSFSKAMVVTGATSASICVLSAASHYFNRGDAITPSGFTGAWAALNNITYYVGDISSTQFQLYADAALTAPLNTSGFAAYSSNGGLIQYNVAATAAAIKASGVNLFTFQDSLGYGLNYATNVYGYLLGQPTTLVQIDEHFSAWNQVFEVAKALPGVQSLTYTAINENWQIDGSVGGALLGPYPASYDRLVRQVSISDTYVDGHELYSMFSYMESGTGGGALTASLRDYNAGKINYGTRARQLYNRILNYGFYV